MTKWVVSWYLKDVDDVQDDVCMYNVHNPQEAVKKGIKRMGTPGGQTVALWDNEVQEDGSYIEEPHSLWYVIRGGDFPKIIPLDKAKPFRILKVL